MTTPIGQGTRLTDRVGDLGGRTVLEAACAAGHEHIVRGVLEGAASPAPEDIADGQAHISYCAEVAAAHGHAGVLGALKESGAVDAAAWQRVAQLATGDAVGWCATHEPTVSRSNGITI